MLPFIQLRLQLFVPKVEAAGGHPVWREWDEQTEVAVTFLGTLKPILRESLWSLLYFTSHLHGLVYI